MAEVATVLSTELIGLSGDLTDTITLIIPACLAVVGLVFGVKKAVSFFTSVSNKG